MLHTNKSTTTHDLPDDSSAMAPVSRNGPLVSGGHTGGYIEPSDTTNEKLVELWLHGKAKTSQDVYARYAREFFLFVYNKPLQTVTLSDLQAYQTYLQSPERNLVWNSVRSQLTVIKSLLSFSHKIGALQVNVGAVLTLKPLQETRSERILPESDAVGLVINFKWNTRDELIVRTLYATGIRASEICSLIWTNLRANGANSDRGKLRVQGKGDKVRFLAITADLMARLVAYRDECGQDENSTAPIFPSRNGKHLNRTQIWRIVKRAKAQAELAPEVSPHWLRHCNASHALDRGADLNLIRDNHGHASIDTTATYLHSNPQQSTGDYLAI